MPQIVRLTTGQASHHISELASLLRDAVDNGASPGFLPPLAEDTARAYWQDVITDVARQTRCVLGAFIEDRLIGAVQLDLATKANARHRAEVQKLCVLSAQRHQGIGRALMTAVEDLARHRGRTLLVLDTRQGDAAERLYTATGWQRAGSIPHFALSADGTLHTTAIFYKLL